MSSKPTSRPARFPGHYPPPLVIPPLSSGHTHTMILLHGRGSNASIFAPALLSTQLPSGLILPQTLPTTQFIFPTASFRRATFANRTPITQWFDNASLEDLDARPELQVAGLRHSTVYLHELIHTSAGEVGLRNVVIGGLSLGACASLIAALTWNGGEDGVAGVVCMAARLPLIETLRVAIGIDEEGVEASDENDIVFEADDDKAGSNDMPDQSHDSPGSLAVKALRDELDIDSTTNFTPGLKTPFFLSHGTRDDKVPVQMGKQAAECLELIGCDVTWHEYTDLGHWYHGQGLADIVHFLHEKCNVPISNNLNL